MGKWTFVCPNCPRRRKKMTLADIYEGINKKHIDLAIGLDLAYELGQKSVTIKC